MDFTYDANPYEYLSAQEWRLVQEVEQRIAGVGDIFSAVLDYARHHNLPQEVIDTLQDFENKAAWLCLAGTEIALDAFIEGIETRQEDGEHRFCLWCNEHDEREQREFFLKTQEELLQYNNQQEKR
jgi:hypothetical protein